MQITALRATLDAPRNVEIAQDPVRIDARVTLTNQSDHSVVLSSPAGKDPHFWHVLDSNQREVARQSDESPLTRHHASPLIATGHEAHESFTASVPARKLRSGRSYTLRVVFHGCPAEVCFTAFTVPKKAAAKEKKTAKDGKQAASRKPAKKKTTKKKTKKKTKKATRKTSEKSAR
ncbi:MAG: hypothetical protein DWQ36_25895 [Acidobacteria bacterium]|nr:MAG: hypothetical protein DWQ30_17720 [Acidobacteriota bacterium]REJ99444.1 MAG: hypothetical protein DWQ36_25895 [Acidobacteriota bacterium]